MTRRSAGLERSAAVLPPYRVGPSTSARCSTSPAGGAAALEPGLRARGDGRHLRQHGFEVRTILKLHEGRPHVVDELINGGIDLVVNTPLGRDSHIDDAVIRQTALKYEIPCVTTLSGAMAAVEGIAAMRDRHVGVRSLQGLSA